MWDNALDFQVGSLFAAFLDFFLLSETLCLILERRAVVPRLLVSGQGEGSYDVLHSVILHTGSILTLAYPGHGAKGEKERPLAVCM